MEKDVYKLTISTVKESLDYSAEKKEGYHMPKKKKAVIWSTVIANLGLVASLLLYGYNISDNSSYDSLVDSRKKARKRMKEAKQKMKMLRK